MVGGGRCDRDRHIATILIVYCTVMSMLVFLQVDNKSSKWIELKPQFLVDLYGSLSRLLNFQPLATDLSRVLFDSNHRNCGDAVLQWMPVVRFTFKPDNFGAQTALVGIGKAQTAQF